MEIYGIIFLVLFLGFFAFIIVRRIVNSVVNRRSSEKEVKAKVNLKKCSITKNTIGIETEFYYIVFEKKDNSSFKCYVKHRVYEALRKDEEGILVYKGKKFIRFINNSGEIVE